MMSTRVFPSLLLPCLLLCLAAPAWSLNMGALGDSLTDEYLGQHVTAIDGITDFAAKSWVQILAETRGGALNFGSYSTDPTLRGEPRNMGYAYNWARAGGTATTPGLMGTLFGGFVPDYAPLAQQAQGLLPTVQSGDVDVVFSGIGSNDFLVRSGIFGHAPALPMSGPDYDAWEANLIASIFAPLDLLHAAGAGHILVGLIPGIADSGAGSNTDLRNAITHANGLLIDGAAARGYRIVDMFGWRDDAGRVDAQGNLLVGGLVIAPDAATAADLVPVGTPGAGACNSNGMCAGPTHALHQKTEDGIHPNTIMQGLIANEIIGALNGELNLDIAALSDRELVQLSGAPVSSVPLPAGVWLFGSALLGLGALRNRTRRVAVSCGAQ